MFLRRSSVAGLIAGALFALASHAAAQVPPLFDGSGLGRWYAINGTMGDFDGDGRQDVLVFNTTDPYAKSYALSLYRGDGFGRFIPSPYDYSPFATDKEWANSYTALDVTGDGLPEVVYSHYSQLPLTLTVRILTFVPGSGFVLYDTIEHHGTGQANAFVTGDFDANGEIDLAYTSNGETGATVVLQTNGDFAPFGTHYATQNAMWSIASGDVDGDGVSDLMVGEAFFKHVALLLSNGAGGFTNGPALSLDPAFTAGMTTAYAMTPADVDADGNLDLVIAEANNSTTAALGAASYRGDGAGNFAFTQRFALGIGARATHVADLDHDGHLDVLVGGTAGLRAAFGDGTGHFTTPFPADTGGAASFLSFGTPLHAADLDGDDLLDVIVEVYGGGGPRTFLGLAPGRFATPPAEIPGPSPAALASATGDVDGDGDIDYVTYALNDVAYEAALNDGNGDFSNVVTTTTAGNPIYAMELARIDGDTRPDVVSVRFGTKSIEWRSSLGNGSFGTQNVVSALAGSGPLDAMTTGDIDNDGDIDVVATATSSGLGLSVFTNVGGQLVATQFVSTAQFIQPTDLALCDVTGDGRVDVVCASGGWSVGLFVYPSIGGGAFGAPIVRQAPYPVVDIGTGDLNHDGLVDLALQTQTTSPSPNGGSFVHVQMRTLLVDAAGAFTEVANIETFVGTVQLSVLDIDADGNADVIGRANGRVLTFRGDGTGALAPYEDADIGAKTDGIAVANFDADPEIEVAYHRWTDPVVHLLDHICPGRAGRFGHGCPGTAGRVPELTTTGCVRNGETVTFALRNAVPNSIAILFFGLNGIPSTSPPGCAFQITPLFPASIVLPLFTAPDGAGAIEFPVSLGNVITPGMRWTEQAVCADAALPWGFTVTNALEFVGG